MSRNGTHRVVVILTVAALVLMSGFSFSIGEAAKAPAATNQFTRQIPQGGTTSFKAGPTGVDGLQWPEFFTGGGGDEKAPVSAQSANRQMTNRSYSHNSNNVRLPSIKSKEDNGHGAKLATSFDGLNHRDQRLANGGNQFSIEPPDQGLCVGNGYVMESVNDVLRVFDRSGNPLTGVVDLNTFYGYAAQFNRTTGEQGAFVTDPSCLYDKDTQRWFQVVLTLDIDPPTGNFLGPNHIDIAVSMTSDPTGSWVIYRLPVQNDGTDGTPDHGCSFGPGFGPCIGDYPHIGADKYGFYVTTNEYSLFGPEYKSANIYALSKSQLAANAANVNVVQMETVGMGANGNPGFTIWPAINGGEEYYNKGGGVEFFLSSDAAEEANGSGTSSNLLVWALSNTRSLNSSSPSLSLSNTILTVNPYALPPKAEQKPGDYPLGQCLNDTDCATNIILGGPDPFAPEPISHLDTNDTRMQQVYYSNGRLTGALDTSVTVNGEVKAGIEYFVVQPKLGKTSLSATLRLQGYLALANNNLSYPAIAVNKDGKGAMAFTVVGEDYYPSAGYASFDLKKGAGSVQIAAAGLGVSDGFTSYAAFVGNPPRTRWGDYGAAVSDGKSIWMASEYVAQTCTLEQYLTGAIGSCGGTRTALANWATRISQVRVGD